MDTGVRGMIAVGLVPPLYKLDHQPGWLPNSVAFHADDGKYVMPLHSTCLSEECSSFTAGLGEGWF